MVTANSYIHLLESKTRSGSGSSKEIENDVGARGLTAIVDATATSGDGTEDLQIDLEIYDPVAKKWITLITDTFTDGATGTRLYQVYPGVTDDQAVFQAVQGTHIGRRARISWEVLGGGGTGDYTFSVAINYLV